MQDRRTSSARAGMLERAMRLGALLVGACAVTYAGPLTACQTVVVVPCYIADTTGPVLITNSSQVTFTIGSVGQGIYTDTMGDTLPADPNLMEAQTLAAGNALNASGNAPIAPNPGGSQVVTNSTTSYTSGFVDTPVAQQVNDYQTTILAVLNGSNQVYNMTFDAPLSDPAVQAAIAAADGVLAGDGASFGSPSETSNGTSLTGTQIADIVTGIAATGATLVSYSVNFGPAYIGVGANQSELFTVLAGQEDINVNTENFYTTDQNVVTTSMYLTTQVYEIDGSTSANATPEPATFALVGAGLAGIGLWRRRRPA